MFKLLEISEADFNRRDPHLNSGSPLVAFFGHDSNEPTIVKRVHSFAEGGARVAAFTFTRVRGGASSPATWFDNLHLGFTQDRNYLQRMPNLVIGLFIALSKFQTLRQADVIYARNIDMAIIAALAKALSGSRAALAYEVLDIQRIFFGENLISKLMRFAERRILSTSRMLVVSSPDFIENYFSACQGYSGPWRVLENNIAADREPGMLAGCAPPPSPPWKIGWFGPLRCRKSLDTLCAIADRLGRKVFIEIRGAPSEEDLPVELIRSVVAQRSNMAYGGAYTSPDDLAYIYNSVHFSWCVDFLDEGANSDWLLPNRIYEGGLYAVPAIARAGTATARKVEEDGLGVSLKDPLEEVATKYFRRLKTKEFASLRDKIKAMPASKFIDRNDTTMLLEDLLDPGDRPGDPESRQASAHMSASHD